MIKYYESQYERKTINKYRNEQLEDGTIAFYKKEIDKKTEEETFFQKIDRQWQVLQKPSIHIQLLFEFQQW